METDKLFHVVVDAVLAEVDGLYKSDGLDACILRLPHWTEQVRASNLHLRHGVDAEDAEDFYELFEVSINARVNVFMKGPR